MHIYVPHNYSNVSRDGLVYLDGNGCNTNFFSVAHARDSSIPIVSRAIFPSYLFYITFLTYNFFLTVFLLEFLQKFYQYQKELPPYLCTLANVLWLHLQILNLALLFCKFFLFSHMQSVYFQNR